MKEDISKVGADSQINQTSLKVAQSLQNQEANHLVSQKEKYSTNKHLMLL